MIMITATKTPREEKGIIKRTLSSACSLAAAKLAYSPDMVRIQEYHFASFEPSDAGGEICGHLMALTATDNKGLAKQIGCVHPT